MRPLNEEYFYINNNEKETILSAFKSYAVSSYNFYRRVFQQNEIPTFFLNDLIYVIEKKITTNNKPLDNILQNLKLINTPLNKKIIKLDKQCFKRLLPFQKEDLIDLNKNIEISSFDCGYLQMSFPGLGKTRTSSCMMSSYYKAQNITFKDIPLVVFVPKTLIQQWIESLRKAFPNTSISTDPYIDSEIYVLNYDKIYNFDYKAFTCIIDEGQYLHNFRSERFKEFFDKLKLSQFTIILTGTPIRESVLDVFVLYSLITRKIQNLRLLEKIYNYLADNIEYAKVLIPRTIKDLASIKTKKDVFDNVGEIIVKPLIIKVNDYDFIKNKLALDKLDSTYVSYTQLLREVKKIQNDEKYQEYFSFIYSNSELTPAVLKAKLKEKFGKVPPIIEQYIDVMNVYSTKSLKSKLWRTLLDETLKYLITKYTEYFCKEINRHNKVLIVTKSRDVIPVFLKQLKEKCNIEGISIDAEDSYVTRYEKLKRFETKKKIKFLISTYPIVEAGIDLPYVDNIFILDFPFRPHSLFQVIHRTQRLNNIESPINITFLKVSYKYNILDHHKLLLDSVMKQVKHHYMLLKKIIDKD